MREAAARQQLAGAHLRRRKSPTGPIPEAPARFGHNRPARLAVRGEG